MDCTDRKLVLLNREQLLFLYKLGCQQIDNLSMFGAMLFIMVYQ